MFEGRREEGDSKGKPTDKGPGAGAGGSGGEAETYWRATRLTKIVNEGPPEVSWYRPDRAPTSELRMPEKNFRDSWAPEQGDWVPVSADQPSADGIIPLENCPVEVEKRQELRAGMSGEKALAQGSGKIAAGEDILLLGHVAVLGLSITVGVVLGFAVLCEESMNTGLGWSLSIRSIGTGVTMACVAHEGLLFVLDLLSRDLLNLRGGPRGSDHG